MAIPIATFLGLGANLGDPVQSMIDARKRLDALPYCIELTSSSFYWSSPVGFADQPAFINCVIKLLVSATATQLFNDMRKIETGLGRERCERNQNAPRLIDIVLLLFGQEKVDLNFLQIPHPRMLSRRFVIEPLLEIEPNITIAGEPLSVRYTKALKNGDFQAQEIYRLGK